MRLTLACLFALSFFSPVFGQQPPTPLQPQTQSPTQLPAPVQTPPATTQAPPKPKLPPTETLRNTRRFFIRSNTFFVKSVDVEASLSRRKEFQDWKLEVTTDALSADAVIEIDRIQFTTNFPFRVTDRETETVIAAGKVSSLFGSVASRVSDSLVKQIKKSRAASPQPPVTEKKPNGKDAEKAPPTRKRTVANVAENIEKGASAPRKRFVNFGDGNAPAPTRKRTAED